MIEGYKDIEDIIEELAEESEFSIAEIKDMWEYHIKYIKAQMVDENVFTIQIPYLGNLCLNTRTFDREIIKRKKAPHKKIIEKVKNLKEHENYTKTQNAHKRPIGTDRLYRNITRNYDTGAQKLKIPKPYKKTYPVIERHSNKPFAKREEPLRKSKRDLSGMLNYKKEDNFGSY